MSEESAYSIHSEYDEGELDEAEYEQLRDSLQERYRFYIMNPPHERGVNYSLWIQEESFEYPILSSNTGGFVTFNSRHKTVGDGIRPTVEFFTLLGWGFHEAMCFIPDIYFRDEHFERTYKTVYDGKPRKYETWAAHVLIHYFTIGQDLIPEFQPIAEWSGLHTEFGVPILGEEARDTNTDSLGGDER